MWNFLYRFFYVQRNSFRWPFYTLSSWSSVYFQIFQIVMKKWFIRTAEIYSWNFVIWITVFLNRCLVLTGSVMSQKTEKRLNKDAVENFETNRRYWWLCWKLRVPPHQPQTRMVKSFNRVSNHGLRVFSQFSCNKCLKNIVFQILQTSIQCILSVFLVFYVIW